MTKQYKPMNGYGYKKDEFFDKATPQTKDEARQYAIDWQNWQATQSMSYGELAQWQDHFTTIAKEYNLSEEFTENDII